MRKFVPRGEREILLSIRAAFIAVLVCGILAIAAWWMGTRSAPTPLPVFSLPAFAADRIRSLSVMQEGQDARSLVRSEIGPWVLNGRSVWPVETVRIRAAASLIDQLMRGENVEDPGEFVTKTKIVAEDQAGNLLNIDLADSVVGGRLFAKVLGTGDLAARPRIAKADFASVFTPQGLDAWRTTLVFTALAEQPTRIGLESAQHSTTLRRNLGRWGLERSPPVPADTARVRELMSQLAVMKVERFLDGDAATPGTLNPPAATISVSSDFRASAEEPKRSVVQTLRIGSAADAAATTVIADLQAVWEDTGETLWGPQQFAIPVAMVAGLTADPAQLATRVPMAAPAADVGVMRISKPGDAPSAAAVEWKRTLDGWSLSAGPESMALHASAVMELLTTPGSLVSFEDPAGAVGLATVSAWTPGGTLVEVVELHTVAGTGAEQVWSRVGDVWRMMVVNPSQTEGIAAIRRVIAIP